MANRGELLWEVGPRPPHNPFPQRVVAVGPAHALTEECISTKGGVEAWGEIGNGRALRLLAAERSRLERERDEAVRVLRNLADRAEWARDTIGEANPILFDRLDGDIDDARALLARLGAGGEED